MERREDWREWGEAGRSLRWAREVAIRRTGASLEAIASLLGASLLSRCHRLHALKGTKSLSWRRLGVSSGVLVSAGEGGRRGEMGEERWGLE